MADRGHELTDEMLKELEARIRDEYEQAAREIVNKLKEHLRKFKQKDLEWRARLDAGDITNEEYINWRTGQLLIGKRWIQIRNALAADYHNANLVARNMIRDQLPDVYALNYNFGTYLVEHDSRLDTSFILQSRDAIAQLMRKKKLLPDPWEESPTAKLLAENKDLVWNGHKIASAILQGIMQGEDLDQMALRLISVADMNLAAAIRNARTMVTNAQNAGREDSFKRADKMGIDLEKMWIATLDNRTRHSHRQMDGVHVPLEERFPNDCKYPGDPTGPAEEIYNCRCSIIANIKGFEFDASDLSQRYSEKLGDMTYDEWKNEHALTKEQEQAWIRDGQPPLSEWRETASYKKLENARSDAEQFERYREVLGDLVPKDVASFQEMKYNDTDAWDVLKKQYRTVNQYKVDSGSVSPREILRLDERVLTEKRTKFEGKLNHSGNIAGAYLDGNRGSMFFAHSRMDVSADGYNGESNLALLKPDGRFWYKEVELANGTLRGMTHFDSEAKLFELFADIYEQQPFTSITMLSERGMCGSCEYVMEQFKELLPDVAVNVVSNKRIEGDVWKGR